MANRKGVPSFKDLSIAFFTGGTPAVVAKAEEHDISRGVLQKAADYLIEVGQDPTVVAPLYTYIVETHGESNSGSGKGRNPAELGQTRSYKAQQVGKAEDDNLGDVFGRIPLAPLGTEKGDKVSVSFCATPADLPNLGDGPYIVIRANVPEVPASVDVDMG